MKIEWYKKGEEGYETLSALIIQSDEGIFFFNLQDEDNDAENKTKKDQEVTLEMIRGVNNNFYFVVTDKNTMNDSISKLRFFVKDGKLGCKVEAVPHPYAQDIIAFEPDSLFTNDVESV